MIEKIYRCDLCTTAMPQSALVAIAFKTDSSGSFVLFKASDTGATHHICGLCIAGIRKIGEVAK